MANESKNRMRDRALYTRLFLSGLLWAPVVDRVLVVRASWWLPAALIAALVIAAGRLPGWKPIAARIAGLSSYGAIFVWAWTIGQGAPVPPAVLWSGFVLLVMLAASPGLEPEFRTPFALCVLVCGVLVSFFSGPAGAADPWLRFFRETLGLADDQAQIALFATRKGLHFTFYGAFAWSAAKLARHQGVVPWAAAAFALAWVVPHSVFDEVDQLSAGNRNGSWADVALDGLGAIAFTFPFWRRRAQ